MSGATHSMPMKGDTVAGKYRLLRVLGEGGMGIVYEAVHLGLNQRVALKMLKGDPAERMDAVARFEREARAVARLRGQNVAHVSDVDRLDDGTPYIVMEYLDGHDLGEELADRGRLPVRDAVDYLLQACLAMAEAHQCNIVHRDLKPSNLYLCALNGRPTIKVLDFGISKLTVEDDRAVTQTHLSLGTPLYMSPEQIRSAKHVDERSDIWSLGVILYELLAGTAPFDAEGATAVIAAITADDPKPLRHYRPDISEELESVVMKALEKDPNERYAKAEAFAEALLPFADEATSWTPPAPHSRPSVSPDDSAFLRETELAGPAAAERRQRGRGPMTVPGWTRPTSKHLGKKPRLLRAGVAVGALLLAGIGIWRATSPSGSTGSPAAADTGQPANASAQSAANKSSEEKVTAEGAKASDEEVLANVKERPSVEKDAKSQDAYPAHTPSKTLQKKRVSRLDVRTTSRAPKPSDSSEATPGPAAKPPVRQTPPPPAPTPAPGRNPLHL